MTQERKRDPVIAAFILAMVAFLAWLVRDLPWPWKALVGLYAISWTLEHAFNIKPGKDL